MLPVLFHKLCFVDIETTGTNPVSSRIIEIGILRVENNRLVRTFQTLLNPQCYIDTFVEKLTGIPQDLLENAPTFAQVKDELLDILQDAVFVAHNVRFDYGFIRNEFKRHDVSYTSKHFCTIKLARLLYPGHSTYNLDSIMKRFNIKCARRHRAFDDAKVLWEFYQKARLSISEEGMEKAVSLALRKPSVPLSISQKTLDTLPQTPGVYIFYGENGMPLYIGKSINLRDRVLSHFSSDHLCPTDMKISQQLQHIETIQTSGELGALFLESTLIKKYQPLFNKKLRVARKLIALKKIQTADGYYSIQPFQIEEVNIEELDDIVGIFKSQKQMKDVLYEIAKAYKLCPKLLQLEKTRDECFSYHLEQCKGACIGKVSTLSYNLIFDEAFYRYKIKQWPFGGPILIKEKGEQEEHFVVDKWCFLGSIRNDWESVNDLKREYIFDYDTYKILTRYLKSDKNLRKIHTLQLSS